jgi:hypothetical protein
MYWAEFYEKEKLVTLYQNHSYTNCTPHIPNEGKLMDYLFQISKNRCKWITVIDADEYIAPSSDIQGIATTEPFLKHVLYKIVTSPIVRMPWYIMSSHGFEKRPYGLITSKYIDGKFLPQGLILMKTIIQSRYVESWTDSHHPLKFSWLAPSVSGQTMREYSRPFLVQPNEMTHKESCLVPRSPLLIRHYQALSWHDFNSIKRNRTLNSFGTPNAWAENPRRKWLEFNFSRTKVENKPNSNNDSTLSSQPHCYRLGDSFRIKMNKAVKLSAQERLQRYRNENTLDYVGSKQDFNCWLYGLKLQPR